MKIKLFNINIEFKIGFFIYIYFFILMDKSGFYDYFVISVILHELAHIVTMLYYKINIEKIVFCLSGIYIISDKLENKNIKKQFAVMIAGSFFNLFLALFFYILGLFGNIYFISFSATNLIIGAYNLFLINGLDGADILNLVLRYFFDYDTTNRIYKTVIVIFEISALILLVYLAFKKTINYLFLFIFISLLLVNILYELK